MLGGSEAEGAETKLLISARRERGELLHSLALLDKLLILHYYLRSYNFSFLHILELNC